MKIDIRVQKGDCLWGSPEIAYRHVIDKMDLERIILPRDRPFPGDQFAYLDYLQKLEQQKRYIEMISAKIAYALTDFMQNEYWKQREFPKIDKNNAMVKPENPGIDHSVGKGK